MVLKALNIQKYCSSLIFSREDCLVLPNNLSLKNIELLGRYAEDVLLIDNSICSFCLQPASGIYISSFYGDEKDSELLKLGQFLVSIQDSENLAASLRKAGYDLYDTLKQVMI
jgi:TFIIF-interacting CTD phosphatase-like protein